MLLAVGNGLPDDVQVLFTAPRVAWLEKTVGGLDVAEVGQGHAVEHHFYLMATVESQRRVSARGQARFGRECYPVNAGR